MTTQAIEGIATDIRNSAFGTLGEGRAGSKGRANPAAPTAQIISLPDLQGSTETEAGRGSSEASLVRDWSPLHQIKATLQVCVGEVAISVGELLAIKEHQVLRLNRTVDQPVDLSIEGKVVARGQLVAVDGHFAVRICELPVALGLSKGS